ncbi:uncharacterized protein LOC131692798 [Topomyia yanbarensis]|uniref:uncharacterized protein LOC131692798 n=1 Tax=Topomyia yanbarensis TaxID=2498891 RepID=UPI00273AE078|nr:uncharacterized protein LOC131692798 [Topomyia yanbarensis]
MTNLKSFVANFDAERDSGQLEGWKQRIANLYHDFQFNRLQMESALDETGESKTDEKGSKISEEANRAIRRAFEQDYVMVYSFLTNMLYSNPQLSPIDKLSYLVASLSKDARKVIESIEHTAANYTVAWHLLERRFDNKKLVVKTYIDSLFSIDPMKRESYESLMQLVDDFERNLCMIEKMNIPTDGWSVLLAHMVCSRLDPSTLKQWEIHHKSTDVPTYHDVIAFLRTHLTVLQSLTPFKARSFDYVKSETVRSQKSKVNTVHTATNSSPGTCPFCSKYAHSPFKCDVFQKLSVALRFEQVKKLNLCINCFSSSHLLRNCSSGACRVCNQKHHTMLHQSPTDRSFTQSKSPIPIASSSQPPKSSKDNQPNSLNQSSTSRSSPPAESQTPTATASSLVSTTLVGSSCNVPATVLLQTAIVKVFNSYGNAQWARALLDPASQLNLITENLVQKCQLRRYSNRQEIGGVGNSIVVSYHAVTIRIGSRCSDFLADAQCHILKKITRELPVRCVDTSPWHIPSNIVLADPKFHEPGPIDLLIGMELYYDLLLEGFLKLGPEKPILQGTVFGWVASGKVGSSRPDSTLKLAHVTSTQSLDEQLSRFWEIESCWTTSTQSLEETACENHFAASVFRDQTGRFVVTLPKRAEILNQLGNSKEIATRRFRALERRFDANPHLKEAYTVFIDEYHQLNHMRVISDSEASAPIAYYLPHHGVEKAKSTTTKLRVVFDASCRTDTGISLNQALMVGPVIQDDLLSIILRFRMHRYVIIADIEKMFRQIRVHPSDYPLQRILWRCSSSQPLRTFELTTVTYGTASAPYLATKCLQRLSEDGSNDFPLASLVLGKDFYMDDMLTGVDNEAEGSELCRQLLQLLQSAGLSLRKWSSNSSTILSEIPPELRDERSTLALDSPITQIKTLGLHWQPSDDVFRYSVPKWSQEGPISRRIVLSDTARLYDPLGLIGPVVVIAKLFVQTLWRTSNNWDDPLDEAQQQHWLEFHSMITLHWLSSSPSRWKTFIANRVSEVQHLTSGGVWAHVPGIENPADIISRGMYPDQLKQTSPWWSGAPWLSRSSRFWPPLTCPITVDSLPPELLEEKAVSLPIQVYQPNEIFFIRSSFSALVRIVALLCRFIHNSKPNNRSSRRSGLLCTMELNEAVKVLVRLAQSEVFAQDIAAVSKDGQVGPKSALKHHTPIIVDGILRIRGRLRHAAISLDRKHPMILPTIT